MTDRFSAAAMALAFSLLAPAAGAATFHSHQNDRFGFVLDLPDGWRADPPPENGDGVTLRDPEGGAVLTAFGRYASRPFPAEAAEFTAPQSGETQTFAARGAGWLATSGARGGSIYYRKAFLACSGEVLGALSIEYAASAKGRFDAIVTRVARSFRPGAVACK